MPSASSPNSLTLTINLLFTDIKMQLDKENNQPEVATEDQDVYGDLHENKNFTKGITQKLSKRQW